MTPDYGNSIGIAGASGMAVFCNDQEEALVKQIEDNRRRPTGPVDADAARRSARIAERQKARRSPSRRNRPVWRYPPLAPRVRGPNPDHNDIG